jgi:hypothetical protein
MDARRRDRTGYRGTRRIIACGYWNVNNHLCINNDSLSASGEWRDARPRPCTNRKDGATDKTKARTHVARREEGLIRAVC